MSFRKLGVSKICDMWHIFYLFFLLIIVLIVVYFFLESKSLKYLSNKLPGAMFCNCSSTNKYKRLDEKLKRKLVEIKRGSRGNTNFKSINSIILRFPQFKEELKHIRDVFEQYGKHIICLTLYINYFDF